MRLRNERTKIVSVLWENNPTAGGATMTLLDIGLGLMLLLALVAGSVFTMLLMIAAIGDGRSER